MSLNSNQLTLERALFYVVSEYKQITTVPSGYAIGGIARRDGIDNIPLNPSCQYEGHCPVNFSEFFHSAAKYGINKPEDAFPWYCRSRLRYSCATLIAGFLEFGLKELKSKGMQELWSTTLSRSIQVTDLVAYSVRFIPEKQHAIVLRRLMGINCEIVEALYDDPPHCDHSVLCCKHSGVVVDLSLGQFTGQMIPRVFPSVEVFLALIPGKILAHFAYTKDAIDEQLKRDKQAAKIHISVGAPSDLRQPDFAKRWVKALLEAKPYCDNCCGMASPGTRLMRCSRCKQVQYCCKQCQLLAWKTHKRNCQKL